MAEQEEEDDEEIQLKESYTIERLNQRTTKDVSRAIVKSCLMILEQKWFRFIYSLHCSQCIKVVTQLRVKMRNEALWVKSTVKSLLIKLYWVFRGTPRVHKRYEVARWSQRWRTIWVESSIWTVVVFILKRCNRLFDVYRKTLIFFLKCFYLDLRSNKLWEGVFMYLKPSGLLKYQNLLKLDHGIAL